MAAREPEEFFLDIAGDGFVIAGELELSDEAVVSVRRRLCEMGWDNTSRALRAMGECREDGCGCSRHRNPAARDAFLEAAVGSIRQVSEGRSEVAIASLASGLLRFELLLVERLLEAGVPVTTVHVVDPLYDRGQRTSRAQLNALAQFASWLAKRGVDVHAYATLSAFSVKVRQAGGLPVAVVQVDCSELSAAFESAVQPMLEEVLAYGGLFCVLTARDGTGGDGVSPNLNAWGEVWRLVPEVGRLRRVRRTCYRIGSAKGVDLPEHEPLPPVAAH